MFTQYLPDLTDLKNAIKNAWYSLIIDPLNLIVALCSECQYGSVSNSHTGDSTMSSDISYTTLAQSAYHSYGMYTGFRNFQGTSMPAWDDLPDSIQNAWKAAVADVVAVAVEHPDAVKNVAENELPPIGIGA